MRLIDADRLKDVMEATLENLKIIFHQREQQEHLVSAFYTVRLMIDNAETVPNIELVRCKDCKHCDGQELCLKHGFFVGLDLTFFCKSGESKDDE